MTVFEKTTIDAVNKILNEKIEDYSTVWSECLSKYTESKTTITKGCPKNAFSDLCSFGFVKDVPKKESRKLSENGRKTIKAVEILNGQNWYFENKKKFWKENFGTNHQGQMDIILALKNKGLLNV